MNRAAAKPGETLRWRIASFLDRRPDWCWSDLVMWVLHWPENGRLPPGRDVSRCQRDANQAGSCYCNKVQAEPWAVAVLAAHQQGPRDDGTWGCSCSWEQDRPHREHIADVIAVARAGTAS